MIDAVLAASHARVASASEPLVTIKLPTLLHRLTEAYTAGNAPLGEQLLLEALDQALSWDAVCAAAAEGIAAHRHEHTRA